MAVRPQPDENQLTNATAFAEVLNSMGHGGISWNAMDVLDCLAVVGYALVESEMNDALAAYLLQVDDTIAARNAKAEKKRKKKKK